MIKIIIIEEKGGKRMQYRQWRKMRKITIPICNSADKFIKEYIIYK